MSPSTIAVIGSGPAGLVTAYTLIKDGFDVQILTRDSTPGGVWAVGRVYPGVALNTYTPICLQERADLILMNAIAAPMGSSASLLFLCLRPSMRRRLVD